MTDEERRQKLCEVLRTTERWTDTTDLLLKMAADEIERLAKRLEELEKRDRDIANDIRALARWI